MRTSSPSTACPCTVYEANPHRLGGRCWTSRGWANGQTAEHGGEFIDTVQHSIRGLAAELGLALDDLRGLPDVHPHARDRYFLRGARRSESEAWTGYHRIRVAADRDARRIGSFRYDRAGRAARRLDERTAAEWLDEVLQHDHPLLKVATRQYMAEEYGLDLEHLSAINMVMEFGSGGLPSDERFHIRGGNDQLVSGLAARLPAKARSSRTRQLTALVRRPDGRYRLRFRSSPSRSADVVVLCAPFAALRHADLDGAGLSRRKLACIQELGMGTNAKVILELDRHVTHYGRTAHARWSGEYYDARVDTWASSLAQPGRTSVLTVYSGGRAGASYDVTRAHGDRSTPGGGEDPGAHRPGRPAAQQGVLRQGLGRLVGRRPAHARLVRGLPSRVSSPGGGGSSAGRSIACTSPGEHTSMRALGYLDGAVASGRRAAHEVLDRL